MRQSRIFTVSSIIVLVIVTLGCLVLRMVSANQDYEHFENPNSKYIYQKGIQGFGDRLQCLLQSIGIAKQTGRILVVDWEDEQWCHNLAHDFHYFFQLDGIQWMTKQDFLRNAKCQTFYPEVWSMDSLANLQTDKLWEKPYDNVLLNKYPKNFDDIDCLVHGCTTQRNWTYNMSTHMRLQQNVLATIHHQFERIGLPRKTPYTVVHLRGGDRLRIAKTSLDTYIQQMFTKFNTEVTDDARQLPVVVVSDEPILIDKWRNVYDGEILVNDSESQRTGCFRTFTEGIHNLKPDDLYCDDLQKKDLNIAMLRDFLLIANATHIVCDGKSCFSTMARDCKANDDTLFGFIY